MPLHVIDTAGLRESADEVERIGVARAWDEIAGADAVLFLHDLERANAIEYRAADADIASAMAQKVPQNVPIIDVWNKSDCVASGAALPHTLGNDEVTTAARQPVHASVRLSARTGAGLDDLRRTLLQVAGWQSAPEGVFMARARHVEALQAVNAHLQEADAQLQLSSPALDLLAEELRLAQNALGEITGAFTSDDLLGVIFSSFCIGK